MIYFNKFSKAIQIVSFYPFKALSHFTSEGGSVAVTSHGMKLYTVSCMYSDLLTLILGHISFLQRCSQS